MIISLPAKRSIRSLEAVSASAMIINSVIARSSLLSLISAVATLPTNSRANNKTEVDRTSVAVAEAEIVSSSKGITKA